MKCLSQSWCIPPKILTLGRDEVHVWRISLDQALSSIDSLEQILAPDERGRSDRFHFQRDRKHFIVARGLIKVILSQYLGKNPAQLRFSHNSYGKPALAEAASSDALRFNVSHSHGLALLAVARERELGIDLEYIRPEVTEQWIAERFFSPREVAALRALPPNMQVEAFFHCWTRKEAYVKAKGEGLSLALDQFEVSLVPGEPAALLSTNWDPTEAFRWSLKELTPAPGYTAALAVEGHQWQLKCWQWSELISVGRSI